MTKVSVTTTDYNHAVALRLLCAARNITPTELARRINASPSYLTGVAAGRRKPGLAMLKRIAGDFNIPLSLLLLLALPPEGKEFEKEFEKLERPALKVLLEIARKEAA